MEGSELLVFKLWPALSRKLYFGPALEIRNSEYPGQGIPLLEGDLYSFAKHLFSFLWIQRSTAAARYRFKLWWSRTVDRDLVRGNAAS